MLEAESRTAAASARVYWRESDARVWVEAWRQSGRTQAAFAREHGIHVERLARWARRLRDTAETTIGFHPVRLRHSQNDRASSHEPIELDLGDGRTIRLSHGFDAVDLQRVLSVLGAMTRC
jgi:hypothetical protein